MKEIIEKEVQHAHAELQQAEVQQAQEQEGKGRKRRETYGKDTDDEGTEETEVRNQKLPRRLDAAMKAGHVTMADDHTVQRWKDQQLLSAGHM